MTFGVRLKELRQDKELTQEQLSSILNTSKSNISKYEANIVEPNIKTLILISRYFNVSTDYLLGMAAEKKTHPPQKLSWEEVISSFPTAILLPEEDREFLTYFQQLQRMDKRWVVGQMIDIIKKEQQTKDSNNTSSTA